MKVRVVVADERAASLFDMASLSAPLERVGTIENPDARPPREIESDRPGRGFVGAGGAHHRHAYDGERTSRRWHAQIDLARQIATAVDQARARHEFDRLVIMAGPRMLGLIRDALPAPTRALVKAEVPKDLAHLDERSLKGYVPRESFWKI
jgi:protein required for attachment to host cells